MPTFIYTAKNKNGETQVGNLEAPDQHILAAKLREIGLVLISAKTPETFSKEKNYFGLRSIIQKFRKVSLVEKMMFTRHLAIMIKSGLPINQSLRALAKQTKNFGFRKIINQIEENVQQGEQLNVTMSKYPKIFDELYVNMIQVGETAGNLDIVLVNLAEQMRKDHDLVSRIKGAMIYPIIIIITLIGVGAIAMIVVVPKLTAIFTELNIELPITTRIVIGTSNFIQHQIILSISLLIAAYLILKTLSRNRTVKKMLHRVYLRIPVFGALIQKVNSARFARTFSSLINSGLDIVKALQIVANILSNIHFKESLEQSAEDVRKGQELSETLGKYEDIYPPMVIEMIQVGEKTGNLSDILENLAGFYEEEIDRTTRNLSSIIEPIVMIVIGIAVGFFAISMLQPMYSMMQGI